MARSVSRKYQFKKLRSICKLGIQYCAKGDHFLVMKRPGTMLKIRRYERADAEAVIALHRIALMQVGAYAEDRSVDQDLDHIEEGYLQNNGEFLVGIFEDRVIAMGALRRTTADRAEIKRMRVHPGYQRRGFGQTILDALEQRARELGYRELHLDTTVQQNAAQKFYEKNGYVKIREGKMGQFECLFYEKTLVT